MSPVSETSRLPMTRLLIVLLSKLTSRSYEKASWLACRDLAREKRDHR